MVRSSCGLLLVLRDYSVQISGIDGRGLGLFRLLTGYVSACLIVLSVSAWDRFACICSCVDSFGGCSDDPLPVWFMPCDRLRFQCNLIETRLLSRRPVNLVFLAWVVSYS